MPEPTTLFVDLDVHKTSIAVAHASAKNSRRGARYSRISSLPKLAIFVGPPNH